MGKLVPAPNTKVWPLECKTFSATLAKDRDALGERVTTWLRRHPHAVIEDRVVLQSSDAEYHCVTIVLFYRGQPCQA